MKNTVRNTVLALLLLCMIAVGVGSSVLYNQHKDVIDAFRLYSWAKTKEAEWHTVNPKSIDELDIDYDEQNLTNHWGILSNSAWLFEQMTAILPYMDYEHAVPERQVQAVRAIVFVPYIDGGNSFHILGKYFPSKQSIEINAIFLLAERRKNEPDMLLSTLVHELVHAQWGAYVTGTSEQLESATQAMTVEILAAMCRHGNGLACEAFYTELAEYSLAYVTLAIKDTHPGLALWLNHMDAANPETYDKSMAHWESDPDRLKHIMNAYVIRPWQMHLIPNVHGVSLFDTGFTEYSNILDWMMDIGSPVYAEFDDTRALLEPVLDLLYWDYENWLGK